MRLPFPPTVLTDEAELQALNVRELLAWIRVKIVVERKAVENAIGNGLE